jgi:hypothetical protein
MLEERKTEIQDVLDLFERREGLPPASIESYAIMFSWIVQETLRYIAELEAENAHLLKHIGTERLPKTGERVKYEGQEYVIERLDKYYAVLASDGQKQKNNCFLA